MPAVANYRLADAIVDGCPPPYPPHQGLTYRPETSKEICKTSGHAIMDSFQRRIGIFSCLMSTTKSPQINYPYAAEAEGREVIRLISKL
ncbi:hypothetical protein BDV37DRAFT_239254, partial [Aspergillus pseudonomiae]